MTIREVRLDLAPGTYSTHVAALTAAVSGDEIVTTQEGEYLNQDISAFSAKTDITIRDTVGGNYVVGLTHTTTARLRPGNGWLWVGGTIRFAPYRTISVSAPVTCEFRKVVMELMPGGPANEGCCVLIGGGTLILRQVRIISNAGITPSYFINVWAPESAPATATLILDQVYNAQNWIVGFLYAYQPGATFIEATGVTVADLFLHKRTATTLYTRGVVAPTRLVENYAGTSVFDCDWNCYETTQGASSGVHDVTGFTAAQIREMLDWRGGAKPRTPLQNVPAGLTFGTLTEDAYGNPRHGRSAHLGAVQGVDPDDLLRRTMFLRRLASRG